MDMEWASNLNLVLCSLSCLAGVLFLLVLLKFAGASFLGLSGIIVGLTELWTARRQPVDEETLMQDYRRSSGQSSVQSRVQAIRAKYDQEFHGEEASQPTYPAVQQSETEQNSAQYSTDYEISNRRRRRREQIDYDDEMDSFIDDLQL